MIEGRLRVVVKRTTVNQGPELCAPVLKVVCNGVISKGSGTPEEIVISAPY